MTVPYPEISPYEHGLLDVGDGNRVYWETCGSSGGKPALVLHGGPGSGCIPWHRRLFNPGAYRIVLFDQRGCGRSRPHAGLPDTDISSNTTWNLVGDIERLRNRLDIERWLVFGGSWGSTLALAYAEKYPDRVSEIVLWGGATGRKTAFDWWFRGGAAMFFPDQWAAMRDALPPSDRAGDIVGAYCRLLNSPDPNVRHSAAVAWCKWESATLEWPPAAKLAPRFADPDYAMCFARLVTHYVRHNAWLEDGCLIRDAGRLANIPGIIVSGRLDLGQPIGLARELQLAWPSSRLVVVEATGHALTHSGITREVIRATDEFAHLPKIASPRTRRGV